jgi:hypothetical protein
MHGDDISGRAVPEDREVSDYALNAVGQLPHLGFAPGGVETALRRLELGNVSNVTGVGAGVFEYRLDWLRLFAAVCRFFHSDGTRHGTRRAAPRRLTVQ